LAEKVEYYLTHEEFRQKIAQNGCARVLREHGYRDRLKKIQFQKNWI
jgi:spore maturation protein CgeB